MVFKRELEKQIADLEKENRLLGERCNQLLKDKGDLTDKIADIKANCDLAIEGRDIKIKELELELTVEKDQHQEEINLHLHAEDYIKSLEKENKKVKQGCHRWFMRWRKVKREELEEISKIEELEQQIEKMKCCQNCKNCAYAGFEIICRTYDCINNSKWEIKEND